MLVDINYLLRGAAKNFLIDFYSDDLLQRDLMRIANEYRAQYDFIVNNSRYSLSAGGVGSAKTWMGAYRAGRAMLGWIGDKKIPVPNIGMATALTDDQLEIGAKPAFRAIMSKWIRHDKDTHRHTDLLNGSRILWRTAGNIEAKRAATLAWWWGGRGGVVSAACTQDYDWAPAQ